MKLKDLFEGLGARLTPRLSETDITSLALNSKEVRKGSLFIAIKGFKSDGHDFIKDALRRGAAAIAAEKCSLKQGNIVSVKDARKALSVLAKNFYGSPSEKLTVIGITGTNGKTTISLLAESIFRASGISCGVIGTVGYRVGKTRVPAERTTPDALLLNKLLYKALKSKCGAVVMEVSSHALDQNRVDDIFFDAAIFTNLTHEHLDYHGDMERYFASKVRIFKKLKKQGSAIINIDDSKIAGFKEKLATRKITYGLDKSADVTAEIKRADLNGSNFTVRIRGKKSAVVNTRLVGIHNVSNILAVVALGISQGLTLRNIKEGIARVDRIPGRLEPVRKGQKFKVFVDYAHTHDALENVLKFLSGIKKNRIITVFGCGGDRDKEKRPLMGEVAGRLSDYVVLTSDNPRSEKPGEIIRDIEKGMTGAGKYTAILDRHKAIEKALKEAGGNDIVLIAGKGHEKEQIIGNSKIPFDDKKVAESVLKTLNTKS